MNTEPRDVIADRLGVWANDDWKVYDRADLLIEDLGDAGFVIRTGLDHERQMHEDGALMDLVRRLAAAVPSSAKRAVIAQLDEFQQRLLREATSA